MMRAPSERARLYFLLAWFHAITQERLRYAPLGWAKYYEFNESDLRVACDTLDTWIEATAMVRTPCKCSDIGLWVISKLLQYQYILCEPFKSNRKKKKCVWYYILL